MNTPEWNPGTLLETSGFYWKTCTLHTGVKLDIFTVIGSGSLTANEITKKISGDDYSVLVLLNALASMGLLIKKEDSFSNTTSALTFLSRKSDKYIGFMIMHHHHLVESWYKMDQAIINGGPIRDRASFSDEQRRESFLMGMFNMAMAIAPKLSKELDLDGCSNLLDLGGGPGTFAIHFCLENQGLEAKVFDLPTTRPFAEKTIKNFNISDRVTFIKGDYNKDTLPFKNEFDAAWLSHILHGEGPDDAEKIIAKASLCLKSKGKIFIHEFILNKNMDGPLFPALFSINMLLGTEKGRSYSEVQLFDMLERQGFKDPERLDFIGPTQSGIIVARKI